MNTATGISPSRATSRCTPGGMCVGTTARRRAAAGPASAVEVVALGVGRAAGPGPSDGRHLRGRRPRPALLEPDDVVDAQARRGRPAPRAAAPRRGATPPAGSPTSAGESRSRQDRRSAPEVSVRRRSRHQCSPPDRARASLVLARPRLRRAWRGRRDRRRLGAMTTTLITGANKGLGSRDRPPPPRGRPHRLDRRPRRDPRPAGRRRARRPLRPARRHRRRLRGRRGRRPSAPRAGSTSSSTTPGSPARTPTPRSSPAPTPSPCSTPTSSASSGRRTPSSRCCAASAAPTIVNVTSGLGSFAAVHDAGRGSSPRSSRRSTPSSKSAVTMLTVQYAKALPGHPDQRRRPRLHGDRPQRQQRAADGDRGHRRDRRAGHSQRRRRPDRHLHRPRGSRALLTARGSAGRRLVLRASW